MPGASLECQSKCSCATSWIGTFLLVGSVVLFIFYSIATGDGNIHQQFEGTGDIVWGISAGATMIVGAAFRLRCRGRSIAVFVFFILVACCWFLIPFGVLTDWNFQLDVDGGYDLVSGEYNLALEDTATTGVEDNLAFKGDVVHPETGEVYEVEYHVDLDEVDGADGSMEWVVDTSETKVYVELNGDEITVEKVDFGFDGKPVTITLADDAGTVLDVPGVEADYGDGTEALQERISEAEKPIKQVDNTGNNFTFNPWNGTCHATKRRLAEWSPSPDPSQGQLASQCLIVLSGMLLLAIFYALFKIHKQRHRRRSYPKSTKFPYR